MYENGYTQIVGRIKDTIIRGGENIDPGDIEEVILKLEGILDAQVTCVILPRIILQISVSLFSNVSLFIRPYTFCYSTNRKTGSRRNTYQGIFYYRLIYHFVVAKGRAKMRKKPTGFVLWSHFCVAPFSAVILKETVQTT